MPAPESPLRVGLVGLGHMGRPIAVRLSAGGLRLRVFDLRSEAVAPVVEACETEPASSLADLGRSSDVVITLLPDGAAVRRAVLGPGTDRLLGAMRPGSVLVDMGSSSPTGTRELGAILAEHGIAMLDAPVSGGVRGAEAGTLAMMVGGDTAVIERCRPILGLVAGRLFVTGALGSGHAMKALNNLVSAAGLVAAGEALLIGRRFGLDPALMLEVLNASTGRNYATEHKLAQFVLTRSWAAGFSLGLMVKDLGAAVDLARDTGTPASLAGECHRLWAQAATALGGDADHTEVVRWLESLAGSVLA